MVETKLRCAGGSHEGLIRHNNEDAFHMDPERGIFAVVDGIGGQAAGEHAAAIAVGRLKARLERLTGTAEQRLREAITMANNEILRAARGNPEWQGMACVLTVALVENGSAVIGHVGDSRLYHIRGGQIRKITHDHSPVGEREDNHELSEAEAMRHPRRNEVFRDVGSEEHSPADPEFIEIERIPFEPDAALLLCSDGLSDQVPSADILHMMEKNAGNPQAAVEELIEAANFAGGKDNVTVVVVEGDRFSAAPSAAAPSSRMLASRPALFLAGLLVAAAAAWLSRGWWTPPPVEIRPRVLSVGSGAPFGSIAAALVQARPGDTVEVAGGEYREQVRLKDGVTVRSRVPLEAILRAAPMSAGPAVVAEGVRGARLEGFSILAEAQMPLSAGIVLTDSDVAVEDNQVAGTGVGIEVRGSASPAIGGNAIRDCTGEGVLIVGPSAPWIWHNSIQRNKGAGLAAREGARPALAGNVFEKNGIELPPEISMDDVRQRNFFLDTARAPAPRRSLGPRPASEARPAPEAHPASEPRPAARGRPE
jgi:serine/threonine protein phosphatase PrpC